MKTSERRLLPAAIACLLLAGVLAPIAVLAITSSAGTTQAQLQTMVNAAESSRAYASNAVNAASFNSLNTGSAQTQLQSGDSLLATAQADLKSDSNLGAGVQAAQAAMADYTNAAATATVALQGAGLTASVDVAATESAVAEVNATVRVVASVEAQACANVSATTSNATAASQACAQVSAQVASATLHVQQAAHVVAQIEAEASASVNLSQAVALVVQARTDLQAATSDLSTIASLSYSQRAQAYVSAALSGWAVQANSTIKLQGTTLENATALHSTFSGDSSTQAAAVANITTAAAEVSSAISAVTTAPLNASVSLAEKTTAEVRSNLTALETLAQEINNVNLETSLTIAQTSLSSYDLSVIQAEAWGGAYSGTSIIHFSMYLSNLQVQSNSVLSSTNSYLSSYASVQTELATLINGGGITPLILANMTRIQTNLNEMASTVTSTTSGVDTSIQVLVSSISNVQTRIASFNAVALTYYSAISVKSKTLSTIAVITNTERLLLNSTFAPIVSEAQVSVLATAQAANSFISNTNTSFYDTVGAFTLSSMSLSNQGTSLIAEAQGSVSAVASAVASINIDLQARTSAVASANIEISQALSFFSSLNVDAGIAAMTQASVELQAASATSVAVA